MSKDKKKGAVSSLMSQWDGVIFSADDIEMMQCQMAEVLLCRAESKSPDEQAHYASQGPARWVGERIRNVLIANDCNWTERPLLSIAEVKDEIIAHSGPMYTAAGYISSTPIENALIDALHAAMQLRAVDMPLTDGPALMWRFCYRLAQASTLVADAGREEALRKGKRGGPIARGDVGHATHLARQFLRENAFDTTGTIRPQKALELEVWEMLFARRNEPKAFQIAGMPGCPTDRAIKTVRGFIGEDYKRMRDHGKARLGRMSNELNELAIKIYRQPNSRPQGVDASPDASPE